MTELRPFRQNDIRALVDLINAADRVDGMDRAVTEDRLTLEFSFPSYHPESDCFLAWEGSQLAGYADLFVAQRKGGRGIRVFCRGVVHPDWRQQGLGRRLLERAYEQAISYASALHDGPAHLQCSGGEAETGRLALFETFGLRRVRYFVNMARPISNGLPPVHVPEGFRLRTFDPQRDLKTVWQVEREAFRDHWGATDSRLEDWEHFVQSPLVRPELWFLAEEEASGEVVGMGLTMINPDWIAQTGRQEGYVDTLGVLREARGKGLGTALLAHGLHALRREGMEFAHLHADAESLTGATRIYERLGFTVRRTTVAYGKEINATE